MRNRSKYSRRTSLDFPAKGDERVAKRDRSPRVVLREGVKFHS